LLGLTIDEMSKKHQRSKKSIIYRLEYENFINNDQLNQLLETELDSEPELLTKSQRSSLFCNSINYSMRLRSR
jgi:hypothetical protein